MTKALSHHIAHKHIFATIDNGIEVSENWSIQLAWHNNKKKKPYECMHVYFVWDKCNACLQWDSNIRCVLNQKISDYSYIILCIGDLYIYSIDAKEKESDRFKQNNIRTQAHERFFFAYIHTHTPIYTKYLKMIMMMVNFSIFVLHFTLHIFYIIKFSVSILALHLCKCKNISICIYILKLPRNAENTLPIPPSVLHFSIRKPAYNAYDNNLSNTQKTSGRANRTRIGNYDAIHNC